MILQKNRIPVIQNICLAAEKGDFYAKVEVDDPTPDSRESRAIVEGYLKARPTCSYRFKCFLARHFANIASSILNRDTEILGMEKLQGFTGGAMITSNHFGPTENTIIRHLARKLGKNRLNVIAQVSNFAMKGPIGYLMNYGDTIPLWQEPHYLQREFTEILDGLLKKEEFVLIYPEQEMWFNYRKPRPTKRGAYYYAARLNAPLICCFVEMVEKPGMDTPEFHKLRYRLHILDVLRPEAGKSIRENSEWMRQRDNELKKAAYEKAYGKPLDYTFSPWDIAGWMPKE